MVFTENLFNNTVSILKSDHLQSVEKVAMYKGINLRAFTPRQRLPC